MPQKCVPCHSASPKLTTVEISKLIEKVPEYTLIEENGIERISKEYHFKDFKEALAFTNRLAEICEEENHHPQIILEWAKVTVTWWTHAIEGLHTNDFIMALTTDKLQVSN